MQNIDNYKTIKECEYKDEHYSARDNGAIMRHQRNGMRKRKMDEVWSFGNPNISTGYMDFCGERVHRIVATAFHGPAPSKQHVVDHIDTNRQNNRPENLRWLTRLENVLTNDITRKKVELICGSVEAFLDNPNLLYGYETEDKNFSWMRKVTKEEAKYCLENWQHWAKTASPNPNYKNADNHIGNWIYNRNLRTNKVNSFNDVPDDSERQDLSQVISLENSNQINLDTVNDDNEKLSEYTDVEKTLDEELEEYEFKDSLSPSAKQGWGIETEFPCCPKIVEDNGLETYYNNLQKDKPYTINTYDTYFVIESKLIKEKNMLVVLSTNHQEDGYYGTYSVSIIKIVKGFFSHFSLKRFGHREDANHFYKVYIGEEKMTEDDETMWDT